MRSKIKIQARAKKTPKNVKMKQRYLYENILQTSLFYEIVTLKYEKRGEKSQTFLANMDEIASRANDFNFFCMQPKEPPKFLAFLAPSPFLSLSHNYIYCSPRFINSLIT